MEAKERPMLMTPENGQKSHAGTKTKTRRILKPQPEGTSQELGLGPPGALMFKTGPGTYDGLAGPPLLARCPYGKVGDRIWIREAWCPRSNGALLMEKVQRPFYKGNDGIGDMAKPKAWPWRPAIHMPRWACRTVVEIVSIEIERLQEITEEDARAEGCYPGQYEFENAEGTLTALESFECLWGDINGEGSWAANPWVWVLTFKRVTS